jgi:hypothetical protein
MFAMITVICLHNCVYNMMIPLRDLTSLTLKAISYINYTSVYFVHVCVFDVSNKIIILCLTVLYSLIKDL